jgi:DNA-binding CsgD family transcriptional regulator
MFDGDNLMEHNDLTEANETDVGRRRVGLAVGLFVAIVVLIGVDLVGDAATGADGLHLLVEGVVMGLALGGVGALWRGVRAAAARAARLDVDLEAARIEASRYKAEAHEALRGLGEAIDSQFERWQLTPAEREVGLLLLKGLTHKEVADVRATSEPTVRQQALMVYRKSGLRSRSELSAFFLEDLLLPRTTRP